MADRIRIEGIEFHGFHGEPAAEREIGHRYRVDVEMELDLRPAALSDDVERTVDYGAAARAVVEEGTGLSVRLVETLAERIAARLVRDYPLIQSVELRVAKLQPAVSVNVQASVIWIRRGRGDA